MTTTGREIGAQVREIERVIEEITDVTSIGAEVRKKLSEFSKNAGWIQSGELNYESVLSRVSAILEGRIDTDFIEILKKFWEAIQIDEEAVKEAKDSQEVGHLKAAMAASIAVSGNKGGWHCRQIETVAIRAEIKQSDSSCLRLDYDPRGARVELEALDDDRMNGILALGITEEVSPGLYDILQKYMKRGGEAFFPKSLRIGMCTGNFIEASIEIRFDNLSIGMDIDSDTIIIYPADIRETRRQSIDDNSKNKVTKLITEYLAKLLDEHRSNVTVGAGIACNHHEN